MLENTRTEFVRTLAEAEREARAAQEKAVADVRAEGENHEHQALQAERQRAAEHEAGALSELEQRLRSELSADKVAALDRLQSEKEQSERQRDQRIGELQAQIDQIGNRSRASPREHHRP